MRFPHGRLRGPVVLAAVVAAASAVTGLVPGTADAAPRGSAGVARLLPSPVPTPTPTVSSTPSVVVSPAEVVVPEGGSALIHVRLSQRPSYGWVTVDSERLLGDPDLSIGPRLLFPADRWSTWQSLIVFAEEDDDATDGTATFQSRISQLPGSGVAVWTARELDNDVPTPSPT
ncbi:hypothetical protein [Microbispora sp. GKU 823]|uniref:hypothetical protein n=1 Tax=Microbispora sp. GKU 823 TaxID=1652100 RepID=UPI0009A41D34|nr:hypothetical protein [Microbispora sp. GKU 823]OPG06815.1 hypothetical protein B1L11_32035 [Microbispora sp. GKU 823]